MLRQMNTKMLAAIVALISVGCASNRTGFTWEKTFDSGVSLAQAESQCEYEFQLQTNADARAGYQRGAIQIWQELKPSTNPTIISCMGRFGYRGKTFELGEVKQSQKEPTDEDKNKIEELRIAAEQGDPVAQVNLAYKYINGNGVYKSPLLAYKWYSIAAEKMERNKTMAQNAQANLGFMWQSGIYVQKNNVKAMMWYLLASTNEEPEATKRRKLLQDVMLERDYAEAKKLATICISKNYKSCDD